LSFGYNIEMIKTCIELKEMAKEKEGGEDG